MKTPASGAVVSKSKVKKPAPEQPSKLFRKLSTVFLVSSAEFAVASPKVQTSILTEKPGGLPIEFVQDFSDLGSKRVIRDKLLSGADISRELEFNSVVLDAEDIAAITRLKPVLAKIEAIGPAYPWVKTDDFSQSITIGATRVARNGHFLSRAQANAIWKKASKYWAGGTKPQQHESKADGSYYANKTTLYEMTSVTVGCQTINRAEIEYIARKCDWEPNIA